MATNIIQLVVPYYLKSLTQAEYDSGIANNEANAIERVFYSCPAGKRAKVFVHNLRVSTYAPSGATAKGIFFYGSLPYRISATNGNAYFDYVDVNRGIADNEIITGGAGTASTAFNYLNANPNSSEWGIGGFLHYIPKCSDNFFYMNSGDDFKLIFWSGNSNAATLNYTIHSIRATIIEEDI